MSIQAIFNNDAMSYIPKISELIEKANDFEATQMYCRALHEINKSYKCIADMNEKELKDFQEELIRSFKYFKWI